MDPTQPSGDLDANHDVLIISVITVVSALSFSALLLRHAAKRIKRVLLYWDDYLVISSWVVTLAYNIIIASGVRYAGFGRHVSSLPAHKLTIFFKAYYVIQFFQTSALATAKLSLLILLHRIFVIRKFQIVVRVLGIIILLWWVSFTLTDALICLPIRSNWLPTIPKHCGNVRLFVLIGPIPWIVTDFLILIAPIFVIKDLQLKMKNKIGLCALFLTGGLTCIVSCYRYKTLFRPWNDPTWDMVQIGVWSVIEVNLTLMCVCIISIKPALQRLYPSSIIFKTRQRWSKLRSLHFFGGSNSNDDFTTRPQSKPATRIDGNFHRLHESIFQLPAAAITAHSELGGAHTPVENYSIPWLTVKTRGGLDVSDDEMV